MDKVPTVCQALSQVLDMQWWACVCSSPSRETNINLPVPQKDVESLTFMKTVKRSPDVELTNCRGEKMLFEEREFSGRTSRVCVNNIKAEVQVPVTLPSYFPSHC